MEYTNAVWNKQSKGNEVWSNIFLHWREAATKKAMLLNKYLLNEWFLRKILVHQKQEIFSVGPK